jgi:alpha-D-ribose 1-methylphosphonate 5-triphosphate diphosphatase
MRPGVYFDHEFSLQNLDCRLALCGITSYFHGISFAGSEWGLRACDQAEQLVRLVHRFSRSSKALVRHFVHARYEITSETGIEHIERLMAEGAIDLLSIMDHTPGQGQFRTMESYIAYKTGTYDITRDEAIRMAELKLLEKEKGFPRVERLAKKAREYGIPLLSHDDDTPEKIALVRGLGVDGSEFPLTMAAVQEARRHGMKVFMGAPNLLRDRSSNGHLKASETMLTHACDALLSDYYPESLVQAAFLAHHRHGLDIEETLSLVTYNPGLLLRSKSGFGSLRPGAPADIVVIERSTPWVRVLQTYVSGRQVSSLP